MKFTLITRTLALVTLLGCHLISYSCCIRVKTIKLKLVSGQHYWQQFDFNWTGATNRSLFMIKNAYSCYRFWRNKFNLHRTIHWSAELSVTINFLHGKLNFVSTRITRTLANSNYFSFPLLKSSSYWGSTVNCTNRLWSVYFLLCTMNVLVTF